MTHISHAEPRIRCTQNGPIHGFDPDQSTGEIRKEQRQLFEISIPGVDGQQVKLRDPVERNRLDARIKQQPNARPSPPHRTESFAASIRVKNRSRAQRRRRP